MALLLALTGKALATGFGGRWSTVGSMHIAWGFHAGMPAGWAAGDTGGPCGQAGRNDKPEPPSGGLSVTQPGSSRSTVQPSSLRHKPASAMASGESRTAPGGASMGA